MAQNAVDGMQSWRAAMLQSHTPAAADLTLSNAVPILNSLQQFSFNLTHYCGSYGHVRLLTHYCGSYGHVRLVPWLTEWFDAGFRSDFLADVIAVVMLSSQSQTERETTQQAPRYSSDSVGCNACLQVVTPGL